MGYRSTVIFGVKEKHKDLFNQLIQEMGELTKDDWRSGVKVVEPIYEKEKWVIFEHEYLKWYDEYVEVKLVQDTVRDWAEDEDMGAFLITLGECGAKGDEIGEWYNIVMEEHKISVLEKSEVSYGK